MNTPPIEPSMHDDFAPTQAAAVEPEKKPAEPSAMERLAERTGPRADRKAGPRRWIVCSVGVWCHMAVAAYRSGVLV